MDKCDKCGSDILMGRCSCGIWYEKDEQPESMQNLERALLDFKKSGKQISSGDHHSGVCFVFFHGDYEKCMNVVKIVEQLEKFMEIIKNERLEKTRE